MSTVKNEAKSLFNTYVVNYKIATETNAIRGAAMIVSAETPIKARELAISQLSERHKQWFKITKITQQASESLQLPL